MPVLKQNRIERKDKENTFPFQNQTFMQILFICPKKEHTMRKFTFIWIIYYQFK